MTMRFIKALLIMGTCLYFVSIAGCSRSNSSGQPIPSSTAQPGDNQLTQPADTPLVAGAGKQTSEKATDKSEISDELHTPPTGSSERQAIMDALREDFYIHRSGSSRPFRGSITFVVNYLKAHNGWAWTNPEPRSSDPNDQFGENSGFLLHQVNGRWQVMKVPPMVNDPDDPENLDYPTGKDVARIRQMYPSVPEDIFPGQ
jgi:hypothetical protein